MITAIREEAVRRGITRLCHFTPSRNLTHIVTGEEGILATKKLQESERSIFTPTDLERLDGHEDAISCSIEYPNAWYFDKARSKDVLFKDWVVLLINPEYLWLPGTCFCPRNAASNRGRNVLEGEVGFLALFAKSVTGSGRQTFNRSPVHLPCCPTDDQAEVLIPDQIAKSDILAIVVRTETQAKDEIVRLRLMNVSTDYFRFIVAPELFEKRTLSQMIRSGQSPQEIPWKLGDEA